MSVSLLLWLHSVDLVKARDHKLLMYKGKVLIAPEISSRDICWITSFTEFHCETDPDHPHSTQVMTKLRVYSSTRGLLLESENLLFLPEILVA